MMRRCSRSSSANRSPVGPCPCGLFHAPGSSLCVLYADDGVDGNFAGGVDCTLSLSTPSSTRTSSRHESSRASNFFWDMFQPAEQQDQSVGGAGAYSRGRGGGAGGEALAARRCANCDTTSTPLWRNGPRGPKSLCNACGIRYKKEERRASSTAAEVGQQHHHHHHSQDYSSWAYAQTHAAAAAAVPSMTAEFRLIHGEEESSSSSSDAPFLSWRHNMRGSSPGLLHDFS